MTINITRGDGLVIKLLDDLELEAELTERINNQWAICSVYLETGSLPPGLRWTDDYGQDTGLSKQFLFCTQIGWPESPNEPVTCYNDCVRNQNAWAERYRVDRDKTIAEHTKTPVTNKQQALYLEKCRERKAAIEDATTKWRYMVQLRKELDFILSERVKDAKNNKVRLELLPAPPLPKDQPEGFEYPVYHTDMSVEFPDLTTLVWKALTDKGLTVNVVIDR